MSEVIRVTHDGELLLETVYDPAGRQPRAYLVCRGAVTSKNGVTTVEV